MFHGLPTNDTTQQIAAKKYQHIPLTNNLSSEYDLYYKELDHYKLGEIALTSNKGEFLSSKQTEEVAKEIYSLYVSEIKAIGIGDEITLLKS